MVSGIPFLTSVDAKLATAEEHFNNLQNAFAAGGKADGHRVFFKHNADSTEVTAWIKFDPPPGIRWASIIGDFANNLRSALDHIVYAIATGESAAYPPPDERRLMFPIADTEIDWKGAKRRIRTLSEPVRTLIEAEQPFSRPGGDEVSALALLGRINDQDKHRIILLGASQQGALDLTLDKVRGWSEAVVWTDPIIDEAPLITWRFAVPNRNVKVNGKLAFQIVLNIDGVWRPAVSELGRVRNEVIRLVDLLRPFVK